MGTERSRRYYRDGRIDRRRVRDEFVPDHGRPPQHFLLRRGGQELLCAWDSPRFETAIDVELSDKELMAVIREVLRQAGLVFESMDSAIAHARAHEWPASALSDEG